MSERGGDANARCCIERLRSPSTLMLRDRTARFFLRLMHSTCRDQDLTEAEHKHQFPMIFLATSTMPYDPVAGGPQARDRVHPASSA